LLFVLPFLLRAGPGEASEALSFCLKFKGICTDEPPIFNCNASAPSQTLETLLPRTPGQQIVSSIVDRPGGTASFFTSSDSSNPHKGIVTTGNMNLGNPASGISFVSFAEFDVPTRDPDLVFHFVTSYNVTGGSGEFANIFSGTLTRTGIVTYPSQPDEGQITISSVACGVLSVESASL